jgi:hypothetical protein
MASAVESLHVGAHIEPLGTSDELHSPRAPFATTDAEKSQ